MPRAARPTAPFRHRLLHRLWLLAVLLGLGLSGTTSPLAAQSYEDLVRKADPAVGRVISRIPGGFAFGSGFILGASRNGKGWYFLTNNHVVKGALETIVGFDDAGAVRRLRAEIVRRSAGRDLAVLLLSSPEDGRPFDPAPLALADRIARKGEAVAALGYPGTADTFSDASNESLFQSTLTTGTVSRVVHGRWIERPDAPRIDIVQHTAALNPGNSGGPLLDMCGAVLGINTALTAFSEGGKLAANDTFWASAAPTAIAYLTAQDIPFTRTDSGCGGQVIPAAQADAGPGPRAGTGLGGLHRLLPPWAAALLAGLLVLAALAAVALLVAARRGLLPGKAPADAPGPGMNAGTSTGSGVETGPAPVPHKPVLILSAETGESLTLGADALRQGVTIGRAPRAALAISDPSISRAHAELRLDGRRLMLRDLGSTNGSFVGEVRLAPDEARQINLEMPLRLGRVRLRLVQPKEGR